MSSLRRYEPSVALCQPRAAVPLRGRRGRPVVKTEELFHAIREDAWQRRGAVVEWCGKHRPSMRKLALSRLPWERAFAARMMKIFRAAIAILEELAEFLEREALEVLEREALEVEAAGEDFGQTSEDSACGVLDPDGEVLVLDELTVEEGQMLSWAMA